MSAEQFDEATNAALGNYVYRLIDPRNGETFYVGKGRGNRVFRHAALAGFRHGADEDDASAKVRRIQTILNAGLRVIHVIHRHAIPEAAVFEVEAALIDAYPGLSNQASGHYSGDRGPMNAQQIIDAYALPVLDEAPPHALVLVNIAAIEALHDRAAILRQTRAAWRLDPRRADRAELVVAVARGVTRGVFRVRGGWRPATHRDFPDLIPEGADLPGRYAFDGVPAEAEVWEAYVGARGRRIVNPDLRHSQNPIRYWRI